MFFNSSWALFSPAWNKEGSGEEDKDQKGDSSKEFAPFNFFGKSFTFEKSEQKIIKTLRQWTSQSFNKHQMMSTQYITKLEDIPKVGGKNDRGKYYDFDLQVKIVQLFKLDEYSSELRVMDESKEIWFAQVFNLKYRWLREGQFVRIRSANLENHDKYERTFGLKHYSNILSLPYPCLIARNMKIDFLSMQKELDESLLESERVMHPVIVSHLTDDK